MNAFEEIMKYKIGIIIEIFNKDDLFKFVNSKIKELEDVPDIYIEIASLEKGSNKQVLNGISEYLLDDRNSVKMELEHVEIELLKIIKDKYDNNEIDVHECLQYLYGMMFYNGDIVTNTTYGSKVGLIVNDIICCDYLEYEEDKNMVEEILKTKLENGFNRVFGK